ncbi:orotidine 5'-phosphate decarboxylase [Hartmannibacter diazotrophicus]|uniref:Orotidine-5'-phosphate decarboxylase n=1 Tax=Hartmannibacter diazotrophicus TaxID=1482074 RepID=A0A2C9D8B8_9HYPH|nr:orotidine-5'-phosphate decarboxylase [Hartmannibacter diazotrophicus]SON56574.1 orotidine 5'-phosphate decarboxylase [Hartmannibacter diazotrophicus]
MLPFAVRYYEIAARRSPLCVGIDPAPETLAAWDLPFSAEGARSFGLKLVEVTGERVGVFKPQIAFFERFGPAGFQALSDVMQAIADAGALCLSDVKRLDIDHTLVAYAGAWIGQDAGFPSDAITVGAYTGARALRPVVTRAAEHGAGIFVLTRSSNPEGLELQNARIADGRTIAEQIADEITAFNREVADEATGPVGAVIGATLDDAMPVLDRLPQSLILAPGIGAQGATISDVARRFGPHARRTLPAVSRQVAKAGPGGNALIDVVTKLTDEAARLLD